MTKIVIVGALLFLLYRLLGSPAQRLSNPQDEKPVNMDDGEMVDYEEVD